MSINVNNDVNRLAEWMPDLITGAAVVDPASYLGLASDYDGAHSKNWDEVACAADFCALVHGRPTSHPVAKILGFLDWTLARKDYMRGEGSLMTWVYTRHIWTPRLVMWAACTVLSQRGDARFAPYVEPLRRWLRAGIGFAAICGLKVQQRSLTSAEASKSPWETVITADGPVPPGQSPVSVAICGRRSWDGEFSDGTNSWFWGFFLHMAAHYLAEFGLGLRAGHPSEEARLIRSSWGVSTALLTAEEQARVSRAMDDSVADLDWVVSGLIGEWVSGDPVDVYRFEDGVCSVLLASGSGPTNSKVAEVQYRDGRAQAMAPTSGHRGSSTDSHTATVDLDRRLIEARSGSGNKATLPMPSGRLLWAYRWPGGAQAGNRVFPTMTDPVVTPPPQPYTPPRESKHKGCILQRFF